MAYLLIQFLLEFLHLKRNAGTEGKCYENGNHNGNYK
jgi:hypothetical protein